jgi:MraZ protein
MFLGTYKANFSGKFRVVLPRKLRDELGSDKGIILTRGLDGCIWGFSKKEWVKQAKKQLEIPITENTGRFLRRYIFASADASGLDHQGRFVISSSLIDFAQIKDEVLIVGAGDHFELWNPKLWDEIIVKDYVDSKSNRA